MSVALDKRLVTSGTRFRVFPQPRFLSAFSQPETIYVNVSPSEIRAGPADDRMHVIDAKSKLPYNGFNRPPYQGEFHPPVKAGADGHFDQIDPDDRAFSCATMYATVRRVLDIWEEYFGTRIDWHFATSFDSLELIPLIEWDNAQSGFGFLEFGYGRSATGGIDHGRPYCQNFDVLAHELGHSIIFSQVGVPSGANDPAIDYGGMHESAGDLVAIIAALHFQTVVDHLLRSTSGNLFTINELDRVGELSSSREIRVAFNSLRMSDVGDEPHERSIPLTGAIFDVMVEFYQAELVRRGLIAEDLATRSTQGPTMDPDLEGVQAEFDAAYDGKHDRFKECLLLARDYLGSLLAKTWGRLNPDSLTYHDILRATMRADRDHFGGANQKTIRECFAWREISVAPGSLLLRAHSIRQCGLDAGPAAHAPIVEAMRQHIVAQGGRPPTKASLEEALRALLASLQDAGDDGGPAPKASGAANPPAKGSVKRKAAKRRVAGR